FPRKCLPRPAPPLFSWRCRPTPSSSASIASTRRRRPPPSPRRVITVRTCFHPARSCTAMNISATTRTRSSGRRSCATWAPISAARISRPPVPPARQRQLLRGFRVGDRHEQELVDALAVHVHDFHLPLADLERVAFGRNARQALERQPGRGMKVAALLLQPHGTRPAPD